MDELNQLCKLSYKTRLIGFASCCAIGIVISFLVCVCVCVWGGGGGVCVRVRFVRTHTTIYKRI